MKRRVRTAINVSETNVTGCLLAFFSISSRSSSKIYISLKEGEVINALITLITLRGRFSSTVLLRKSTA